MSSPLSKLELLPQLVLRLLLFLYVICLFAAQVWVVLPALFVDQLHAYALYLAVVLTSPSIKGLMLVSKAGPDWTYCVNCQSVRPPRTRHCHICDICILRRDHHCVLLAQCVGFTNWRFFFSMLYFGAFGGSLATYFHMRFVFGPYFLPENWSTGFRLLCLFSPPGLMWILRQATLWQCGFFSLTSSCLLFTCFQCCFLIYHMLLMARNQTMYDRVSRCMATDAVGSLDSTYPSTDIYNLGLRENVKQFLGANWFRAVFVPFSQSPLSTDGLSYPRADGIKFK
ncbi:unnamed protein product [Dicrocoelium dendriticum]|nr:unnamed protein product [Dicrocoelium dendriticum]